MNEYEEEIERWYILIGLIFEYGVDRFMVWGELARFIEDMKENAEIDAAYE